MPQLMHAISGLTACDERCYNAKHRTCICVCGGINHGRGLVRASENTRRLKERQGQQPLFSFQPSTVSPQPAAERMATE